MAEAEPLGGPAASPPLPTAPATKPRFSIRKRGGALLPRHYRGLDPGLVGEAAFNHHAVAEWWRWLREDYTPTSSVALITPCSNVKPYTRSPTTRKIRGLLRRLGLWDAERDKPRGLEWLYFSDLLILVPYERAEEYPACCYDVPPDLVLADKGLAEKVATLLAGVMEELAGRGLERLVVYLPRKHLKLWDAARERASRWPGEERVKYSLFSTKPLGEAVSRILGL